MEQVLNHLWAVLLAITWANTALWWQRERQQVELDPSSAPGFIRLLLGSVVLGSIPWIVMGLGLLVGGVGGASAYLRPWRASPWVMLWYVTICVLWVPWLCWLFLLDGWRRCSADSGLVGFFVTMPGRVKALALCMTLAGVAAALIMLGSASSLGLLADADEKGLRMVFVVTDGIRTVVWSAILFITIGLGILIRSLTWLHKRAVQEDPVSSSTKWSPHVLLVLGVLWLGGGGTAFMLNLWASCELLRVYAEGQAQIAEGAVRVLREQPVGGGEMGDLVEIEGVQLTINYFHLTPAYRETIAHGGRLRDGVRARVWHHDGLILRVDIWEDPPP